MNPCASPDREGFKCIRPYVLGAQVGLIRVWDLRSELAFDAGLEIKMAVLETQVALMPLDLTVGILMYDPYQLGRPLENLMFP